MRSRCFLFDFGFEYFVKASLIIWIAAVNFQVIYHYKTELKAFILIISLLFIDYYIFAFFIVVLPRLWFVIG